MNEDIQSWELLSKCGETGSIVRAAEQLSIDPATAGRMLNRLEEFVNRPLYIKRARPFRLTQTGILALEKMRPILQSYRVALDSLKSDATELRGLIRISSAGGYAHEQLIPELMKFMEIYPDIDFDVSIAKTEKDVLRGNVDIAFITGSSTSDQLVCKWRDHSVFIPIASPRYIERHGFPHHPHDLGNHFGFIYSGPIRSEAQFLERNGKISAIQWRKSMRVADIVAIKNAVLSGYGMAVDMPIVHCHKEISEGRLIPVLDGWQVPTKDLYAITLKSSYEVKRIRQFFDWFVNRSVVQSSVRDKKIASQIGLVI